MIDWGDIFLGLLQGATEFLPVSSSGHLFLMEKLFKEEQISLSFVLLLHTATLLSVLAVFFKDIKTLILGGLEKKNLQLFLKVFLSLTPLVFIGLFFRSFVEQSFEKNSVAFGFFSSGILLLSLLFLKKRNLSLEKMSFLHALFIGLAQALAVFPGFSRSAWTIAVGLHCGLNARTAVYFSFLIAIPAIIGSSLFDLLSMPSDFFKEMSFSSSVSLSLPFLTAFVSGLLSLIFVVKITQAKKLYVFSFYLLPLSLAVFLFL